MAVRVLPYSMNTRGSTYRAPVSIGAFAQICVHGETAQSCWVNVTSMVL